MRLAIAEVEPVMPSAIGHPAVKRLLDIATALVVLIVFSWLILTVAFIVRVSSPGAAFYGHIRCGRGRRSFRCWKFRTMVMNAEALLEHNPELRSRFEMAFKLRFDPRVTRIGRLLRKTSLDELPQFLNVLLGDMSLVGPRPVTEAELVNRYGEVADLVTSVRPGITGLWQVSGRSSLSYAERVRLDVEYVSRRSFSYDLSIIARTPLALLRSDGAH